MECKGMNGNTIIYSNGRCQEMEEDGVKGNECMQWKDTEEMEEEGMNGDSLQEWKDKGMLPVDYQSL